VFTAEELANIDPPPFEYNGKCYTAYEATQKQRAMERAMRKQKRLAVGYDAAGLTDDFTAAAVRLSRQREVYKNFSKTAGLYTQFERATVVEMSRKVAGKTAAVTRKLNSLTNSRKSGIIKDSKISSPIEQRNTANGKPNAILHYDVPLNNRQQNLLDLIPEYDSQTVIKKSKVNMKDLSALTAKTGVEFAMFTKSNERLVVRGNEKSVNIDIEKAKKLAEQGYKWSGHTHPGVDSFVLLPSDGDKKILNAFNQERSQIYNSAGKRQDFFVH
jgi:hypothetical protein